MTQQQLEEAIRLHRGTVFRLAYSMVKHREDADDMTQEAFLRLYQSKEAFASEEHVKAWLIRVTMNLCKDLLRCAWRRHRAELSDHIVCESPEEGALLDSIRRLRPEYGAVLYLFYYEGYTAEEIASLRKSTAAAVRARLTRARRKLKELLLKEGYQ